MCQLVQEISLTKWLTVQIGVLEYDCFLREPAKVFCPHWPWFSIPGSWEGSLPFVVPSKGLRALTYPSLCPRFVEIACVTDALIASLFKTSICRGDVVEFWGLRPSLLVSYLLNSVIDAPAWWCFASVCLFPVTWPLPPSFHSIFSWCYSWGSFLESFQSVNGMIALITATGMEILGPKQIVCNVSSLPLRSLKPPAHPSWDIFAPRTRRSLGDKVTSPLIIFQVQSAHQHFSRVVVTFVPEYIIHLDH